MPFPAPNPGESEKDFIGRCMAGEHMTDKPKEQRLAACYSAYRKSLSFEDGAEADIALVLKLREEFAPGLARPFVFDAESGYEVKGAALLSHAQEATLETLSGGQLKARFLVSTEDEDLIGDVLPQKALLIDDWSKNPIVTWNHGLSPLIPLPIGSSRSPDGELGWLRQGNKTYADLYFASSYPPAQQIAALVGEGIIKAASVGLLPPWEAKVRAKPRLKGLRPGLYFTRVRMDHWSPVAIPMNPAAVEGELVRKAWETGRIADEALLPEVREAVLKDYYEALPKPRLLGKGWGTGTATAALPAETTDQAIEPLGASTLSGLHEQLKGIAAAARAALGPIEHPTVRAGLGAACKSLDDVMATLVGCYAESYPDGGSLDAAADPDEETTAKGVAALLAAGMDRYQTKGTIYALQQLAVAPNLRPGQQQAVGRAAAFLQRAEAAAAAVEIAATDKAAIAPAGLTGDLQQQFLDLAAQLAELEAKQKKLNHELDDCFPYKAARIPNLQ